MSESNPYSSLAQDKFLRSPTPSPADRIRKRNLKSIVEVFGEFAKMDDEKQANFLLQLLSYSSFEADFAKMADQLEIQHTMAVQRRFEAIAKKNGYALDKGKVVPKETGGDSEIPAQQIVERQITNYKPAAGSILNNRKGQGKSGSKKQPSSNVTNAVTKAASRKSTSVRKTKKNTMTAVSGPSYEETATNVAAEVTSGIVGEI